jgi:hypothetical protein
MSESEARLALAADVDELRTAGTERGWVIVGQEDLVVVVDVVSRIDREPYRLRLSCDGYPDTAPAIKPIDPVTGQSDHVRAWPACDGFRPVGDICMPLTAEGFALHPEWINDPALRWISTGNPILRVLEELQAQIDNPTKYRGRAR